MGTTELTWPEFETQCPNRIADDEFCNSQGCTYVWHEGDKTFEEWWPEFGSRRWWVGPRAAAE